MAASGSSPTLSIVVPAYNEADNLSALYGRLAPTMDALGETWELVLVNDGSPDATLDVMQRLRAHGRIAIVNLSRNFGKEIATTSGLDHAAGDAVIPLDADLQASPDLVVAWRKGFDTVYAQRRQRLGETWLKRATAAAFYRVLARSSLVRVPPRHRRLPAEEPPGRRRAGANCASAIAS
jgi:polyisoprenyl-phosphate glycosyltransferase